MHLARSSLIVIFLGLTSCGTSLEDQLLGYTGAEFEFVFNAVILNHPNINYEYEGPYSHTRRYCSKKEFLDIKLANKTRNIFLEDSIMKFCHISDYYYIDGIFGKKMVGYKMDLYDQQDCITIASEYNKLATTIKNHPPIDPADRDLKIVYVNNIQNHIGYSEVALFKDAKINKAECIDQTVFLTVKLK